MKISMNKRMNRSKEKRQENEDKIGKYYDGRSDQERQEEIDWGKLATGEFVAIELSKRQG